MNFKVDPSFVDCTYRKSELPSLTKEEVYKLRDNCSDLQLKTALQLAFDTGDRVAELMNYKIEDITDPKHSVPIIYLGQPPPGVKTGDNKHILPPSNTKRELSKDWA